MSPVRPLEFGGLRLENNLLQAPLAGYASAAFRLLAWRWGRPGLLATEMISARALQQDTARQERYLARLPGEGPVAYQLWGCDPDALGEATRIVDERGADVVDLNCGCPVRKVRAAGAGAKLMENPPLLGRLVRAMRAATRKPVTVKIRIGPDAATRNAVEVGRIAEGEGADLLTIHGRHARESYGTPCRLEAIAPVVQALTIPVIGNGDVVDGDSARRMFDATGCAGLMVGRGCMGAPWVFERIRKELDGETFDTPSMESIGQVLLKHHDLLVDLLGAERAIRQCRKLGSFYSKKLRHGKDFRNKLNACHERRTLRDLIAWYFEGETPDNPFADGVHSAGRHAPPPGR
jgi:tRNA-dihydrouridine synthase B